jgi:hypothetical protein
MKRIVFLGATIAWEMNVHPALQPGEPLKDGPNERLSSSVPHEEDISDHHWGEHECDVEHGCVRNELFSAILVWSAYRMRLLRFFGVHQFNVFTAV